MKQRIFTTMIGAVLLLCLSPFVFAGSTIRLFLNGQELETKVPPQIVDGNVMAPLQAIGESLGAKVTWNEKTNSVDIDARELEAIKAQAFLLEQALEQAPAPKEPLTAVRAWAEGVKMRNGALQYAVMAPKLKKESYADFVEANWSTGTSSPWVESYHVIERYRVGDDLYRFEVEFTYTDSTKSTFSTKEYVTVSSFEDAWLVSSIEKIKIKGEVTKITLDKEKKVKSVFVQGKAGESGSYDQANVFIDGKTKIYQGNTDQELAAGDLREGVAVEVIFTEDPRTMIYPVSAQAETIRVIDGRQDNSMIYRNTQYDFSFTLPESWQGYTIVTDKWDGRSSEEQKSGETVETGPMLNIRHPLWTSESPRQDIPIMVFTLAQWDLLKQEKFHIGAAPMDPKELGRNRRYVFALPARYNYAFPAGYEEVESILESDPLKPMEN